MAEPTVEPPLDGYTVVDLSTGIAGAYCTKLLADGGAHVVKVEPPEGDPLRSWSASGAVIPPGRDGALFSFLAGTKRSVVADPGIDDDVELVDRLLAAADAVVWSSGSKVAERPEFAPAAVHRRHPHLTVMSITPFGLEGPWHDRAATEFTLQAWSGGIVGLGRGEADRAPVFVGGQVGEYLAGVYASAAMLASRYGRIGGGPGELLDLSMLETQILSLTYYPVTYFEMLGRPWRDARRLTVPGVARAKDGLVDVGCGTAQQWFDLCAMVGHPEWIDEDSELTITERANLNADEIYAWFESNTVDEIRELATAFRIPNAPVANGANIASLDQFRERGSFVRNPRDRIQQPGHPYRMTPALLRRPQPAPRLGEHTAHYRTANLMSRPAPTRISESVAVERDSSAGHDNVLGGPLLHSFPGDAGRRGHPRGIHPPSRRDPAHRRCARHRKPMVGEVPDLRGAEHQQEGPDAGAAKPARPGCPAPAHRDL